MIKPLMRENPPAAYEEKCRSLAHYNANFYSLKADTTELKKQAFALRYQVYCLERHFEDANEHPQMLETDQFDPQSVHGLVLDRQTNEPIGTSRLILPNSGDNPLPMASLLCGQGVNTHSLFLDNQTAEVSRFAITRQSIRRYSDTLAVRDADARQLANLPCLGLIQMLLRLSLENDIRYWAAVMEPKLLRMLAMIGVRFNSVGALVMHHGLRQPSFCEISQMLRTLKVEKPENWAVITDGGHLISPCHSVCSAA